MLEHDEMEMELFQESGVGVMGNRQADGFLVMRRIDDAATLNLKLQRAACNSLCQQRLLMIRQRCSQCRRHRVIGINVGDS
jgi:hypothetical protein